jgi:hypothetical protein
MWEEIFTGAVSKKPSEKSQNTYHKNCLKQSLEWCTFESCVSTLQKQINQKFEDLQFTVFCGVVSSLQHYGSHLTKRFLACLEPEST